MVTGSTSKTTNTLATVTTAVTKCISIVRARLGKRSAATFAFIMLAQKRSINPMNTTQEKRVREVIKAIRDGVSKGPFWIGDTELYVMSKRGAVCLFQAVPHYANPLSPLSPVVRNAGYKGNILLASVKVQSGDFGECYASLAGKIETTLHAE